MSARKGRTAALKSEYIAAMGPIDAALLDMGLEP